MDNRTPLKWERKSPHSSNNFDLISINPEAVDLQALTEVLNSIEEARHRGLTLNRAATQALRDWIANPSEPLRSLAYVSLSNWFCTAGGDRYSEVASRCERLWDALFRCRPLDRLSSSARAKNQKMLPGEFERFWPRLLTAQALTGDLPEGSVASRPDQLRARFNNNGLHFEVEGSARAIADFLKVYGPATCLTAGVEKGILGEE